MPSRSGGSLDDARFATMVLLFAGALHDVYGERENSSRNE